LDIVFEPPLTSEPILNLEYGDKAADEATGKDSTALD